VYIALVKKLLVNFCWRSEIIIQFVCVWCYAHCQTASMKLITTCMELIAWQRSSTARH